MRINFMEEQELMKHIWDKIWIHANIATMSGTSPYGLIKDAAIALSDGKIAWVGQMRDLPHHQARETYDVSKKCITPALIDCHTHLIYANNRANEFEMRLLGKTYEEIANAGGGILSTVKATRAASEEELLQQTIIRAKDCFKNGVTTLEIKSGYGLDLASELKILRVIQQLQIKLPIEIFATFLGAHTIPPEFKNDPEGYVNLICEGMLPEISKKKLAFAVDVYCEKIGFTYTQTEKIFKTAMRLGLKIKCHAEQLSNSKAAGLAAKYQALSVDHLEHLSEESILEMQQSGTVAVLLPGAYYFLRETKLPPLELLRRYKIPIAVATDSNPGTSPTTSLPLIMNMACILFRMTPEETWKGVTLHAAKALGCDDRKGSLEVGKAGDMIIWEFDQPVIIPYSIGTNFDKQIILNGELAF